MKDKKISVREINEFLGFEGGYMSYTFEWSFKGNYGRQRVLGARKTKGKLQFRILGHDGQIEWIPSDMFQGKITHAVRRDTIELS